MSEFLNLNSSIIMSFLLTQSQENLSYRNYNKLILVTNEVFKKFKIKIIKRNRIGNEKFKSKYRAIGQKIADLFYEDDLPSDTLEELVFYFEDKIEDTFESDILKFDLFDTEFAEIDEVSEENQIKINRLFEMNDIFQNFKNFLSKGYPFPRDMSYHNDKTNFLKRVREIDDNTKKISKIFGIFNFEESYLHTRVMYEFVENYVNEDFCLYESRIEENHELIQLMTCRIIDKNKVFFDEFGDIREFLKEKFRLMSSLRNQTLVRNVTPFNMNKKDSLIRENIIDYVSSKKTDSIYKKRKDGKECKRLKYEEVIKNTELPRINYIKMIEDEQKKSQDVKINNFKAKDIFKCAKKHIIEKAKEIANSYFNSKVTYSLDMKRMEIKLERIHDPWYSDIVVSKYNQGMSFNLQIALPNIFKEVIKNFEIENKELIERRKRAQKMFKKGVDVDDIKATILSKIKNRKDKYIIYSIFAIKSDLDIINIILQNTISGYIPKEMIYIPSGCRKRISRILKEKIE